VGTPANFACLAEVEAAKAVLDLQVMLVSESREDGWSGEVGYLDRTKLNALLEGLDPSRSVALICGPGPMVTAVADTLLDLGLPMRNVVYERFDYGGVLAARQDRRRTLRFAGLLLGLTALIAVMAYFLI
jgi:NAD(P)H-flavin reductase